MAVRRSPTLAPSGTPARHRMRWVIFCAVSAIGLGAAVVAAVQSGERSAVAPVAILGLCVIGIGAALLASIGSPLRGRHGGRLGYYGAGAGVGGGGWDGGSGGGCGDGGGGGC